MIHNIVFFGDSITECSRFTNPPLGDGFVAMTAEKLKLDGAFQFTSIYNEGIGGNTVDDLLSRYVRDALQLKPNVLVIKIGINDAYNDFHNGNSHHNLTHFEKIYRQLISALQQESPSCKIMLLTPYYISDSKSDPLYLKMCEYGAVVMNISQDMKLQVLDTQSIFDAAVKVKPAIEWAHDQIHPNSDGHQLLANAVYPFIKKNC